LELRLPPGHTLLGALAGWSILGEFGGNLTDELSLSTDAPIALDVASFSVRQRLKVAGAERSEAPDEAPPTSRLHRGVEDSAPATGRGG
jgi:hypothetical protein